MLNNLNILARHNGNSLKEEIKRLEESFGDTNQLLKRLTQYEFDPKTILNYKGNLDPSLRGALEIADQLKLQRIRKQNAEKLDYNQEYKEPDDSNPQFFTLADYLDRDSEPSSSTDDGEDHDDVVEGVMEKKLNSHVNGPGLEPEDARLPSTSNLTTTLFKQKRFKELKDKAGVSNVQSRTASLVQKHDEAVFLQPKSDVDLRMRYMSKLTYH